MAGSLNKVMLIGRLGRDPEVRYTKDQTAVANLRLATTEQYTDKGGEKQEKTEWHTVVLWGRQAEVAGEYLSKGRLVFVEGKLETRKWQDQSGADRYSTEIRALNFQMLDSGGGDRGERQMPAEEGESRGGGRGPGGPPRGGAGPRRASSAPPPPADEDPGGPGPEDDDIPF